MRNLAPLDVLIIGGGMITNDQILPSVYHLQRLGTVGRLRICGRRAAPLKALAENREFHEAFPGQMFEAYPPLNTAEGKTFPELYKKLLAKARPRQAAIVAVPEEFHFEMVMECLRHDQHVLCVKPLVLQYRQAQEIEAFARERGLLVGVEYHKRFDRRSLIARRRYAAGQFGEFVMGEAKLIEPYYYRHSNFQNWFAPEVTDPFVYVGCHYVDLVYFITGLKPVAVSVSGVKRCFPNGKEGWMWSNGRVRFENGALLSVTDGLGYPDDGAGSNDQGLLMFCEGNDRTGMLQHNDQDRGVRHAYLGDTPGSKRYQYVSPDYFRLVPWEGPGLKPVGYGYESIAAYLEAMQRIEQVTVGLKPAAALRQRRALLRKIDNAGILATPANSAINELVIEAARLSIQADGDWATISYGKTPKVALRRLMVFSKIS